jgi:hypothetical protein
MSLLRWNLRFLKRRTQDFGSCTLMVPSTFPVRGLGPSSPPSGDKLFYAIQLCFKPEHRVSDNIVEYEGLLAGLRAASALGIKRLCFGMIL